ncbi:Protein fam49b [Desmophyllum pertusum]|uniref:Protein fam49b n=1 Tax=Desmophyllum pertusum TaxID=174260 RepID=A0A9W9Z232_9CNID|nr:Protein fam49b [Desmophyllum pertusum]
MGNLLKLLSREDQDATGSKIDIFLDFENACPTDSEKEVYDVVNGVLEVAPRILHELQSYRGANEEIRQAISNPLDEDLQEMAWKAVRLSSSASLRSCAGQESPIEHLERQQDTGKTVCGKFFTFTLKFDDLKVAHSVHLRVVMTNPAIQNDFSYYRRNIKQKKKANADDDTEGIQVSNEMANRMSLFYATPRLF